MKNLLKSILSYILAPAKAFPTPMSSHDEISSLLKKLRPLSTNKRLIRLGPDGDGGYLVLDDLYEISALFSPGVNFVSGFEKDCARRGMNVFMADKSVDKPAEDDLLFDFKKKFIGATNDDTFMTLDNWVADSVADESSELMLQIDIEGFEYEVFLSASDALMKRFRIIVAEFHSLDQLWSRPFFSIASRTFDKILQTHTCAHIHPNNCCGSLKKGGLEIPRVSEFTFLRNDRISSSKYQTGFPHQLDFDNTSDSTLVLPKCWYE